MTDSFDAIPEQEIALITAEVLRKAQTFIAFCEACDLNNSEIPFEVLLDRVTGCDPTRTEYLLEVPARCPNCRGDVLEKTLVVPLSL